MTKESCVKKVPGDSFIAIRGWQIQFCKSNFNSEDGGRKKLFIVGAALISFFEHWHNVKLQMNDRSSRMNDISESHGDGRTQDESLLQFHTIQEIEAALMGLAAEDQIRRARKCLIDCGVITEHSNPNPRYKFDKTIYYQFHPEVLNDYIDGAYPKNRESYPKNRDGGPKNRGPYKENTAVDVLLEKEPKLYSVEKNEFDSTDLQTQSSHFAEREDAVEHRTPPIPRRPPATWDAVLRLRSTPALDATVKPSQSGDIWERRMFVFDVARRNYPGTRAGLLQEFNRLLKKCYKDKLDIDSILGKMLFALLYQKKCKEHKDQADEFFPAWKNFSTWINGAHWEDEMGAWKSKAEWFVSMCPDAAKTEIEKLKSILL